MTSNFSGIAGRRLTPLFAALMTLGLTLGAVPSASAQATGPDTFDMTESALVGTVACNGGAANPIAAVDSSTTDVSGSNDDLGSSLSSTACGLPLYSISSANDASYASDTPSADDGGGTSTLQQVSLLGGVLTFTSKSETGVCDIVDSQGDVGCSDTTAIQNLTFAGQPITGTFTQPTSFNATDLQVQLPGACTGIALFTGTLTVAGTTTQGSGTNDLTQTFTPVALNGTLTCVGLPLTSVQVSLGDEMVAQALNAANGITQGALGAARGVTVKITSYFTPSP
jgi:hypothetical protein